MFAVCCLQAAGASATPPTPTIVDYLTPPPSRRRATAPSRVPILAAPLVHRPTGAKQRLSSQVVPKVRINQSLLSSPHLGVSPSAAAAAAAAAANSARLCAHAFMASSLFRKKNPKNGVTTRPVLVDVVNVANLGLRRWAR